MPYCNEKLGLYIRSTRANCKILSALEIIFRPIIITSIKAVWRNHNECFADKKTPATCLRIQTVRLKVGLRLIHISETKLKGTELVFSVQFSRGDLANLSC